MYQRLKYGGFTLIELLVALLIITILSSIAVPNLSNWYASFESRKVGNDLLGLMNFARQEAIYSRQLVTVCPLDSFGNCSTNWNQSISVFRDPTNQKRLTDPTQQLREYSPPQSGELTIASLTRRSFQFRPNGMTYGDLGNLTWCPISSDARLASHLILNRGGRLRQSQERLSDGTPIKDNGDPVECN